VVAVAAVQLRKLEIQVVQFAHAVAQRRVRRILQLRPCDLVAIPPFGPLSEFRSHEQQLLARVRAHVGEEQSKVGALLPIVAGHLAEQRSLAMHHFVVRNGQHVIFRPRIHEGKRDEVMVVAAMDGIEFDVTQRVVHPAHVPFQIESQAAELRRPGHAGKRRGLFGNGEHAGKRDMHGVVHLFQKLDGLEILAAAVTIGNPFARLAAVIEIEHRGHRIHPQPIDVVAVGPKQRVAHEEIAHLVTPIIEYLGAPLRMLAQPRIRVLVQGSPVELRQPMPIAREVRRHPIENDADAGLMAAIDEVHEVLRRAVAGRGGVVPHHLIAPGSVQRMFRHAHEFHMRVPHVLDVRNELLHRLTPIHEGRPAFMPWPSPRSQVHFVRIERPAPRIGAAALGQPLGVLPVMAVQRGHQGAGVRTQLHGEAVRVGLQEQISLTSADFVLVLRTLADTRDEELPYSRGTP
jgi:hypothetical protein